MKVEVAKQLHFSAARSKNQNRVDFFEKFARGANYYLWAAVEGDVDPKTGLVVELNQIKQPVENLLAQHLDHYCYPDFWKKEPSLDDLYQFTQAYFKNDPMGIHIVSLQEGPYFFVDSTGVFFEGPISAIDPSFDSSRIVKITKDNFQKKNLFKELSKLAENWQYFLEDECQDIDGIEVANNTYYKNNGALEISQSIYGVLVHDLNLPQLNKEENKALFGRCVRSHGHSIELNLRLKVEKNLFSKMMQIIEICFQNVLNSQKSSWPILSCEVLLHLFVEALPQEILDRICRISLFETPRNRFSCKRVAK